MRIAMSTRWPARRPPSYETGSGGVSLRMHRQHPLSRPWSESICVEESPPAAHPQGGEAQRPSQFGLEKSRRPRKPEHWQRSAWDVVVMVAKAVDHRRRSQRRLAYLLQPLSPRLLRRRGWSTAARQSVPPRRRSLRTTATREIGAAIREPTARGPRRCPHGQCHMHEAEESEAQTRSGSGRRHPTGRSGRRHPV